MRPIVCLLILLASGTGTISGGVVGTLALTLLQNGLHDLRIASA